MTNTPNVSFLIPIYVRNDIQLRHLIESLDSVKHQSYKNWEAILVDDGSSIDAQNYMQELTSYDKRFVIHKNPENQGIVESLNVAFTLSKGNFIARHDADDINELDRIEKQLDFFDKQPLCDALFTGCNDINEQSEIVGSFPVSNDSDILKAQLLFNSRLRHPTLLAKRAVFEALSGYRECKYAEDYDIFVRMTLHYNLFGLNLPLLKYRVRSNISESKRHLQMQSAKAISWDNCTKFLGSEAHKVKKDDFDAFWDFLQGYGKRITPLQLFSLKPLIVSINNRENYKIVWKKEILNIFKNDASNNKSIYSLINYFITKIIFEKSSV